MAITAADVLIETIHDWGVDVVFGLPGDGINGIMEALRTRQDRIRFMQVRHEESAALMACGYAKFTGKLGACLATSGPGGKSAQMVFMGNPRYGCELHPTDFALFAKACGGTGFTVERPDECGRVLDEALATPGPVIVQGIVDPFEPPLPPKVTLAQAAKLAESLIRG